MTSPSINPIETARLAAGILNVANLSEDNIKIANQILQRSLEQLNKITQEAGLIEKGIIT